MPGGLLLSPLDIQLANEAAVFLVLFAKVSAKIRAARSNWKEPLSGELRLDLRYLQRRSKPAGELRECVLRRVCRCDHPEPNIRIEVLVAGFDKGAQVLEFC